MIVDVTWDGVTLAKGATARPEAGGWFVELEQPMPVGTTLTLSGEATGTVRVARVQEGAGAGMLVKAAGEVVTSAPATAPPSAESAPGSTPAVPLPDAAGAATTSGDESDERASAPGPTDPAAAGDHAATPQAASSEAAPADEKQAADDKSDEPASGHGHNGKPPRKRKNSKPKINR